MIEHDWFTACQKLQHHTLLILYAFNMYHVDFPTCTIQASQEPAGLMWEGNSFLGAKTEVNILLGAKPLPLGFNFFAVNGNSCLTL